MVVYLKSGKDLREKLAPDVDYYTRRVEAAAGASVREIVTGLGIDPALIAFVYTDGEIRGLDYIPRDGQRLTLQPPVSGG